MKKLSNNELQEVSGGWMLAFMTGSFVGTVITYLFNQKK
jgi:bacteriocin-like protein